MIKRNTNRLTIYRRHAESCQFYGQPQRRMKPSRTGVTIRDEGCECPFWIHGRVRGKFLRQSLQTHSLITAKLKADAMLDGKDGDGDDPKGGIALVPAKPSDASFEFAAKSFLDFKSQGKGKVKPGSMKAYNRAMKHFGTWVQAHSLTMMRQIDTERIENYFKDYDGGWKPKTAQNRLQLLRVFFEYCAVPKRGWISVPPTKDKELNYKQTDQSGRQPFTPAQVTQILAAVERMPADKRDRARALVLLLLFTGMRISDATFFEREWLVERPARTVAWYYVLKNSKRLKVPPKVQQAGLDALAKLPASEVYFFQPDRPDKYLAARTSLRRGEKDFQSLMPDYEVRVRETTNLVEKVLALAGVPGSCHSFRHTFAVNMLSIGTDVYTVSKMLGHSDVKITEQYLNLIPDYWERMSDATDKLAYVFPQPVAA